MKTYLEEQNVCTTVEQTVCLVEPSLQECEVHPQDGPNVSLVEQNVCTVEEPEWPENVSSGAIFNLGRQQFKAEPNHKEFSY